MTLTELRRRLVSANDARLYAKQREQRRRYSAARIKAADAEQAERELEHQRRVRERHS